MEKIEYKTIALKNGPAFRMVKVKGGSFLMGSAADDPEAFDDEKPPIEVTVADFYIGELPVTQEVWEAVTGSNPSLFPGARRPVEQVSWNDIKENFLPAIKQAVGLAFRLPSESEWEYAARGGAYGAAEDYRYAGSDELDQVGWYEENSGEETRPAGLLLPNALGLYDMSGNVWEWCEDDWHGTHKGRPADGAAWIGKKRAEPRVIRGGGCFAAPRYCRAACRSYSEPGDRYGIIGFRLVLQ